MDTSTTGGNVWASVIDRGLDGWLAYLNRPRDPIVSNATPFGPSTSDLNLAALNSQLQQQQQTQKMMMLLAGGAVVLFLLMGLNR